MSLTEEYTFQLTDTGVVLNDDPTLPFVDIYRVVGFDSPPFRETMRQHEGQHGAFMDAEFEQGRYIVLEGDLYAASDGLEVYLDSLKSNWRARRDVVPLFLKAPGRDERLVFVKPLGVRYDWSRARRRDIIEQVQFLCFAEDPRIYTSTLQTVNIAMGIQDPNGFAFNFGFDLGFGAPVVGNGATVTNGGIRDSPQIMTLTGAQVDPRIIHTGLNRELRFSLTMSASQELVIDPVNRTVLLDGVSNLRSALVKDEWFLLEEGDNFIKYLGSSSDPANLEITYRDAWR